MEKQAVRLLQELPKLSIKLLAFVLLCAIIIHDVITTFARMLKTSVIRVEFLVCYHNLRHEVSMPIDSSCLYCGKPLHVKPSIIAKGYGQYCSHPCVSRSLLTKPDPIIFCQFCLTQIHRRYINGRLEDLTNFSKRKFCSRPCTDIMHPIVSVESRIWPKINWGNADECWEWMGARDSKGYGKISYLGRPHTVSRLLWTLIYGPIPSGFLVCHSCDNPPCCNPSDFFLGTPADNSRDMVRKGRSRNGFLRDLPLFQTVSSRC